MKHFSIPALRLANQHLSHSSFKTPADVVTWFGAIQAQDYLGSLWAIGQRMERATEQTIEEAIADRTIVRSWPMRGTLHFTSAQDLRWMLKLLAPRIIKKAASRYRELELTTEQFKKSEKIISKVLMGGKQKTRDELYALLDENGVSPTGQRGIHILGQLAMEGLLCLGTKSGKQFTFTLLDEWIPAGKEFDAETATAELTKRYFTSHGPATVKDFAWWSGLTIREATAGLESVKNHLIHEAVDEDTYWFTPVKKPINKPVPQAFLLPMYDELAVAYKNRKALIREEHMIPSGNGIFKPIIVLNGNLIGTWTRELKKHEVVITSHLFHMLTASEHSLFRTAVEKYAQFLGRKAVLR